MGLRDQLRCTEIWVVGADRYRNPDDDVPSDFAVHRPAYYAALKLPTQAEDFVQQLQQTMRDELAALDRTLPHNTDVEILAKAKGWIKLSPLAPQPEPTNLLALKAEIARRWPMTSLLDVGSYLRRDNLVSVLYAEELNSTKSSVFLQRTDRHGILGQKSSDFQRFL